jgi:segregation and condensation protein B
MLLDDLERAVEGILFAAGEPVKAGRIALVLDKTADEIFAAALDMSTQYETENRGIRLLRLDESLQLCSAPYLADVISRVTEQRRAPKLSQAQIEVLAIVAYFQPVTRAYVEQVRGVDSAYTVGVLTDRNLIEPCGKLDVPGRPTIYKTGEKFLRVMGITNLKELPELPESCSDDGLALLREKIEALGYEGEL